jgi:hypothetical protein
MSALESLGATIDTVWSNMLLDLNSSIPGPNDEYNVRLLQVRDRRN